MKPCWCESTLDASCNTSTSPPPLLLLLLLLLLVVVDVGWNTEENEISPPEVLNWYLCVCVCVCVFEGNG